MSRTKLLMIALLVVAGVALYRAGAPRDAAAGPAPEGTRAMLMSVPAQVQRGFGRVICKLIQPTVEGMLADTQASLDTLQQALGRSKRRKPEVMRAKAAVRAVMVLDSTARVQLQEGHPVSAFKLALQGNGLVTASRESLRQEGIR